MKACLLKVNYSPAYTAPHKTLSLDTYKGRLNQTKDIYGTSEKQLRQNLEEAALQKKAKLRAFLRDNGEKDRLLYYPEPPNSNTSPSHSKKTVSSQDVH